VIFAMSGWMRLHASAEKPPMPAVRITVGEPWPMQTKCSIRPSGSFTESAVLT
jgi:hypothetical protein